MKKFYIFDLVLWLALLAALFEIGKLAAYALTWLAHHWKYPGL